MRKFFLTLTLTSLLSLSIYADDGHTPISGFADGHTPISGLYDGHTPISGYEGCAGTYWLPEGICCEPGKECPIGGDGLSQQGADKTENVFVRTGRSIFDFIFGIG